MNWKIPVLGVVVFAFTSPALAAPPMPIHMPKPVFKKTPAAAPATHKVRPSTIRNLVPVKHTQGDREFGGNGPDITCRVVLRVAPGGRSILADVHFKARETKSDWSTVEESFTRTVFQAPVGKTIARITSPTTSVVNFRSKKAGAQFLIPGEDVSRFMAKLEQLSLDIFAAHVAMSGKNPRSSKAYREAEQKMKELSAGKRDILFQGNHVHNRTPASGPVSLMAIVGDTGGDDISKDRNGKDDTRIEAISFGEVTVQYR